MRTSNQPDVTILVVEDEDPIRHLVATALSKEGYRVLHASDPKQAAEIIGADLFEVDILFADIMMPHMSGHEFARELLGMRPDLKIIFATGSAQKELRPEIDAVRHEYFLEKPYTNEQLREAVRTVLKAA